MGSPRPTRSGDGGPATSGTWRRQETERETAVRSHRTAGLGPGPLANPALLGTHETEQLSKLEAKQRLLRSMTHLHAEVYNLVTSQHTLSPALQMRKLRPREVTSRKEGEWLPASGHFPPIPSPPAPGTRLPLPCPRGLRANQSRACHRHPLIALSGSVCHVHCPGTELCVPTVLGARLSSQRMASPGLFPPPGMGASTLS